MTERGSGRLVYHADRCTGCGLCQAACELQGRAGGRGAGPHLELYPGVADRGAHVLLACRQCRTAACEAACPVRALERDPRTGAIVVDRWTCIGCGKCLTACPWGMVRLGGDGLAAKCDLCGGDPACVRACPAGALEFVPAKAAKAAKAAQTATTGQA